MSVEKRGFKVSMSEELIFASNSDVRFGRRASRIEHPVTDEQRAQHAEAVELLVKLEGNPYFRAVGYDFEVYIAEPEPRVEVVYTETHEEWLERCRALAEGRA